MSKNKKSNISGAKEISTDDRGTKSYPKAAVSSKDSKMFPVLMGVIFLAAFMAYQPLREAKFIWDDNIMLTDNPLVQTTEGLQKIWFSTEPHDYFPLTLTMLWAEWRLWGMDTAKYLFVDVFQHALGAVLLWLVLRRLKVPAAWLIGFLFALHPVAAASVSWMSECKNTLSFVFYGATFLAYLQFESSGKTKWYVASLFAFLCALLSKTSVVMVPFVLLGLAWWQRGKISKQDVLRSGPFFGLSLILGVLTVWFQMHRAIGMTLSEVPPDSLLVRLLGGSWGLWFYLFKAILPVHLSTIYPRWDVNASAALSYLPGLLWCGALAVSWALRQRIGRGWFFALAYYTATLLPVLGFFQMSYFMHSRVADHWQYLALIGPLALAIGGGAYIANRFKVNHAATVCAAVLVSVLFFGLTLQQAKIHSNPELLWKETIRQNPSAWAAQNNLGRLYVADGNMERAQIYFGEAARLKPDSSQTRYNFGRLLLETDKPQEALPHLMEAVKLAPGNRDARFDLSDALVKSGQTNEAIVQLEELVKLTPNDLPSRAFLGSLQIAEGNFDAALKEFIFVVDSRPDSFDGQYNLGLAYFRMGQMSEAKKYFTEALRLTPDSASTQKMLGQVFEKEGNLSEAASHFSQADYLHAMGALRRGQTDEAQKSFEEALRNDPHLADAHYQLGLIFREAGKTAESEVQFAAARQN